MDDLAAARIDRFGLVSSVLDALPSGVILVDGQQVIQWANSWVRERFVGGDHLTGAHCYEVFGCPRSLCLSLADATPRSAEAAAGAVGSSDRWVRSQTWVEERDSLGDTRAWYEFSLCALPGDEDIRGCLVHVRDVSDHKQVESRLQAEITRRRLLVEQSRDGVVVLDEEGRVYETNLQFARMLGYTMEEMTSLHVWDWEYLYPKERVMEMLRTVDESGDHFETQHRRKDGSVYDVEISTNGAIIQGKKYVFCVCRDVSERKRAEREREALIRQLQDALAEIRTLQGLVPVCSYCKRVRDDDGYWHLVEEYIEKQSGAGVTHGICPECLKTHFPDLDPHST